MEIDMTIVAGILVCVGFMALIVTIMRAILKAKKRQQRMNQKFDEYDPFKDNQTKY